MVKTDVEIVEIVDRARAIVRKIYEGDERLSKDTGPDSGLARETDIVFREVLRHLLN